MLQLDPLPLHVTTLRPDYLFDDLLAQYGSEGKSWVIGPEYCQTCNGTQSFRRYDWETHEVTEWECNCTDQWILYCNFLHAGIEKSYQRNCWSDIARQVPQEAQLFVFDYADDPERYLNQGRGVVFHGPMGTGKTLLSVLLAKDLFKKGYSISLVTFEGLRQTYTGSWKSERDKRRFQRYFSADFLVIDEIKGDSLGKQAQLVGSMFERVVRSRTADDKPTILTTNLAPDDFRQFGDGAITSLLGETSEFLEVGGANFRDRDTKARTHKEWELNCSRPVVFG